jgi:hypothetical protein
MSNIISRRSLLAGLGVGGLFLSGLSRQIHAQATGAPKRAAFLFHANGSQPDWAPTEVGTNFTLTPHLAPLEPVKSELTIMKTMILQRGSGNSHRSTTFSALGAGNSDISFDQVIADHVQTQPIELAIGFTAGGGGDAPSLSQRNGQFLPGERNPVTAYQEVMSRLMPGMVPSPGETGNNEAAERVLKAKMSLLDFVKQDVTTFNTRLGAEEKRKLDLYLQGIRDLETNLGNVMQQPFSAECGAPPTVPDSAMDIVARVNDMPLVNHLFLDVMAIALSCGATQVVSMMWGGGQSDESVRIPSHGIDMGNWHSVSHGDPQGGAGDQIILMTSYLAEEYLYFIQKLQAYPDVDGKSVFDNSVLVWSTQNGTSTQVRYAREDHDRHNTPFIVAGGLSGTIAKGQVIECNDRNHNDLYLGIAQAFGMEVDTIGESDWNQGVIPGLLV